MAFDVHVVDLEKERKEFAHLLRGECKKHDIADDAQDGDNAEHIKPTANTISPFREKVVCR